jgi:FlaA1/EpsC-like NDP-sugar epimerase
MDSPPKRREASTWRAPALIDLAALIGREPYDLDRAAVGAILGGKRILITGAGGSIGSHLALVAAQFAPEQVILMDRAENALFEIDRLMTRRFPTVARRTILHDVVDADQTLRHLVAFRPHVVFHAAAHKHVPLMEDHPSHALTNNLFGTKSIADAAVATSVERFVMISSDKAVNPASVMGATKRLAERYVQSLAHSPGAAGTCMSMVRFGNVLGSACSVLTIWASQIAEGGPVTVTDRRMSRYFMTIPEAATLVIQSGALDDARSGRGAGVYVLDMGEPIRIIDLAIRFCRAHGLVPRLPPEDAATAPGGAGNESEIGLPIEIVFTGIRPGEKLHEELAYPDETLAPTAHPGIRAWNPAGIVPSPAAVTAMVAELSGFRHTGDQGNVIRAISKHTTAA